VRYSDIYSTQELLIAHMLIFTGTYCPYIVHILTIASLRAAVDYVSTSFHLSLAHPIEKTLI